MIDLGLSVTSQFSIPPSPALLFANGESGAWYDPSDLSTLFQDHTGSIPVTAPGQLVGLMLDKSRGLIEGPELRSTGAPVLAGTAPAATYDALTGVGSVSRVDGSNSSHVRFSGLVSGDFYRMTIRNTGSVQIAVRTGNGGSVIATYNAGQSATLFVPISLGEIQITCQTNAATASFVIDSIKRFPGAHAYQSVTASKPVLATVAGKRCLLFDGSDDLLATNAIDFTATSTVTSFFGIQKTSDTTIGLVFETSDNSNNFAGTFRVAAPITVNTTSVSFLSKGTTAANSDLINAAAGIPHVFSSVFSISTPTCSWRRNGNTGSANTASQGTGNFGNHNLSIGRRVAGTLPFNGYLFGLILRGSLTKAEDTVLMESWINGRTGAY